MSWGADEFSGESAYDSVFTTPAGHNGVTFVAVLGRLGNHANIPAASPNVLSVGGTTLSVTSQGNYVSETPWSNTGTGTSPFESQPAWQAAAVSAAGLSSSGRTTPDVVVRRQPVDGRLGLRFDPLFRLRALELVHRRRHERGGARPGRA